MRFEAKSVVFGRKPRVEGNDFKTAFFKLYDEIDPMRPEIMGGFPKKELDFPNIEAVELKGEDLEYFLEGNDLVLNNIQAITIEEEKHKLIVSVDR